MTSEQHKPEGEFINLGKPRRKGGGVGRDPWGTDLIVYSGPPPGIDEVPPAGFDGPLLKSPPSTIAGVSASQLESSAKKVAQA